MKGASIDIYFLIFACVFLFFSLTFFLVIFFNHYRNKQRTNKIEKEELQVAFSNNLLQSQLEIQEQTFNDISQELHDNIGQVLSLAKVQISIMNESDDISRESLNDVKQNISYAITDLRNIAKSLSSERIRNTNLHAAVITEVERINKSRIICIRFETVGDEAEMDDQKKLILFRIIQESLQNIIKHAGATEVCISFHYFPEELQIVVKDNGKGFDITDALQRNGGLGLSNIRTRALVTGGSSDIVSILNTGTTLTLKIPYG
jgi:two-component system NarL family sensor kinase